MSLNKLSTAAIADAVDFANMPEQFGGSAPPPQPGPYRFALSPLSDDNFDAVDSADYGARAKVAFNEAAPLVIVQSTGGVYDQTPFRTSISNVPRRRGKGDGAPVASDWDYLNQALGETARPTSNMDYARKLIARAAQRQQFSADITWSWKCNANKPARFDDGNGGSQEVLNPATGQPHNGCGTGVYQQNVQKVARADGGGMEFPLYITCQCGARVRAFGNLERFRA